MIPRLDELADGDLVDLLDRTRRELATTHAYEMLTGMLLGAQEGLSGAAMAVRALHDGRAAGWSDEEIVLGSPVVLSLTPPRLGAAPTLPAATSSPSGPVATLDHLDQREALRVRVRWLQELLARAADELGDRLVRTGTLPDIETVACLRLEELIAVGDGGPPPSDIAERPDWNPGPPLPVSFRLTTGGVLVPPASLPTAVGRAVPPACRQAAAGWWGSPTTGCRRGRRRGRHPRHPPSRTPAGTRPGRPDRARVRDRQRPVPPRDPRQGGRPSDGRRRPRRAPPIPARNPSDDRRPHRRDRGARVRPGPSGGSVGGVAMTPGQVARTIGSRSPR